jgi:hypothetical protein
MTTPTSADLSNAFSIWYYKYDQDPTFDAENPTDEQEAEYEKILAEVMAENNKNQDL